MLSGSFGAFAADYDRYRPGPPGDAVDWILGDRIGSVVDLGAGTGALSRVLVGRGAQVTAVEPDARMRAVLSEEVPQARAVDGRGESMPIEDGSAEAVIASTSWHWMDLLPTLAEVHRVLVPGGVLGALWTGLDPQGLFVSQAREILSRRSVDGGSAGDGESSLSTVMLDAAERPDSTLEIPEGTGFSQPEKKTHDWNVALTADDLIGLLQTFSWVITMREEARGALFSEARRLLRDLLGVVGEVTVDVEFHCEAYRAHRLG